MTINDATLRQIEAASPDQSTWLSANAGSGKTRVLTDRVARLLLAGTRPENILCLTYTKAAASEMQNRLFERLGQWAMLDNVALRKALKELGTEQHDSDADIRKARTLFAAAIETPGGLKIQTIHSFCAGILRRFPLEAGVSPQFEEIDERKSQHLREEVLQDLAQGPNASALSSFAEHFSGVDLDDFLASICANSKRFERTLGDKELESIFDLQHGFAPDAPIKIALIGNEQALVQDLVKLSAGTSSSYIKFAEELGRVNLSGPGAETLESLFKALLFADRSSKSRNWPQSRHKTALEALAPVINDMHAWMDRVADAYQYQCRVKAYHKTKALYDFATPYLVAFQETKAKRAYLDFDDLIVKAKALLQDPIVAQWVLFRLDGGVDHVLVDEAQDTSPDQWEIIRLLTQEFAVGEGAQPERERTVFVVGDKKQSIYSFQGADPEGFDRMRAHFHTQLKHVHKNLFDRELLYSFRSSEAVLRLVDEVFKGDMQGGVGSDVQHLTFHDQMPGRVDLWPAIEPVQAVDTREWDDPVDMKGETDHQVRLANQIATEIKRMIHEETLPVKVGDIWARRPISEGDILILVQNRCDLFDEIIAACKKAKLNVAGADRLKLGGELAVKDLSALLQFLALPEDDLSLAAALKSPLFGWSEHSLYHLAQPRPRSQTLWEALRKSGEHPETMAILDDLRRQADFLRPYDLINRVLVRHDGRRKLLARLGQEAEDGIDALLSLAIAYEQSDVPSLTGFTAWLQGEDVTIKRQLDNADKRIRVMTIHGAKGLEAPIVFLPDTAKKKAGLRSDLLDNGEHIFWRPPAAEMPNFLSEVLASRAMDQERERRRLLYVALTRAENWLIIAAAGEVGDEHASWHSTLANAMNRLDYIDQSTSFGTIKRLERWGWNNGELRTEDDAIDLTDEFEHVLPIVSNVPKRATTLSPSELGGEKVLPGNALSDLSDEAMARGTIIHALLEHLPELSEHSVERAGLQLIQQHPEYGLIDDPHDVLAEAIGVLQSRDLNWVFRAGLSEVSISANLDLLGGQRVFGVIDRLIITDRTIKIVDYKTNRQTPETAHEVPSGLVRQMAAYREAVQQIYPHRDIQTFLLWTHSKTLTKLTDQQLNNALKSIALP